MQTLRNPTHATVCRECSASTAHCTGGKPLCTHTLQYGRKWYAAIQTMHKLQLWKLKISEQAEWVFSVKGGLSVLADGWWRKKRSRVEGLESTHTDKQWPRFERVQNKCASRCALTVRSFFTNTSSLFHH